MRACNYKISELEELPEYLKASKEIVGLEDRWHIEIGINIDTVSSKLILKVSVNDL